MEFFGDNKCDKFFHQQKLGSQLQTTVANELVRKSARVKNEPKLYVTPTLGFLCWVYASFEAARGATNFSTVFAITFVYNLEWLVAHVNQSNRYPLPVIPSTSQSFIPSVNSIPKNLNNSAEEPISLWVEQLAAADHDAARRLWAHFCQQLMDFARSRMSPSTRRVYDEEDAAVSAFRSLCRGIEAKRFPDVGDRGNLWALLVVITSRKIANRFRYEHQQRRDSNQTLSEFVLQGTDGSTVDLLQTIPAREPTPEFAVEVADMSEYLMTQLPEPDLRKLVVLKLEGHTNDEIAELMKVTRRTVQRKLELIRRIWLESVELPKPENNS